MRKISYSSKFKKDEPLEAKYKDHTLSGNYADFRECHIKPDLLLIYTFDDKYNELVLTRFNSHSELF